MDRKGLKICKDAAEGIRYAVSALIERRGRVSARVVETARRAARLDAEYHRSLDPEFLQGNGPAVERES